MPSKERFHEDDWLAEQSLKNNSHKGMKLVTMWLTQGELNLLTMELTSKGQKRDSLIGLVIKKSYKRGDIKLK